MDPKQLDRFSPRRSSITLTPLPASITLTRSIFNLLSVQLFFVILFLIFSSKFLFIKKFLLRQAFLCALMLVLCIASAVLLSNLLNKVERGIYSKEFPGNYLLLCVFTLSLSYIFCRLSYEFQPYTLFTSFLFYLSISTTLSLYLCTIETYINVKSACIVSLISMILASILVYLFYGVGWQQIGLCGIGGVGVMGYLVGYGKFVWEGKKRGLDDDDEVRGVLGVWSGWKEVGKLVIDRKRGEDRKIGK